MATVTTPVVEEARRPDLLSGTPRAGFIDRWIYVFTAASFIAIVLIAFIPDSRLRLAMIKAGQHPPFPVVAHVHAVLMGSFLLLLLTQTVLVATGRTGLHRRLGLVGMVLAPALVVAGLILATTTYHTFWQAAHFGPPPARQQLMWVVEALDNVLLVQIQQSVLFPLFMAIGLRARERDPGFHKRMMILAIAPALPAAFDRMTWLPTTNPDSYLATNLYVLLAVSPIFAWDVIRNRGLHRAYWVWLPIYGATSVLVNLLWQTPWWHATAPHIMGV